MMGRGHIVLFAAVLMGGCSQTVETHVASKGQPATISGSFSFSDDKAPTPELRYARSLVSDSLSKRGLTVAENAPLHLEVTLAVRPASLALGTAAGAGSLSPAKRKKPLQSCEDHDYRVGVTLTRIADGALAYQGSASEHHCNMPLAEALPGLVDAAVADLGNPRGVYSLKRVGRD
jgi:hypothetical protein